MDDVFKALADPTRRDMLDRLRLEPGLTLKALSDGPDMTRFGVMKHLEVLEAAGLVTAIKRGREKHHYLNPIPLEEIAGRWITQFARQKAQILLGLKDALEQETPSMTDDTLIFQIVIRATPEEVWQGITDPEFTKQYFHNTRIRSDFAAGSPVIFENPDGSTAVDGEVLECAPPNRLVISWKVHYNPDAAKEASSRVAFEISAHGPFTRLTVTHDAFATDSVVRESVQEGWPFILSNLKTLLETGAPMGDLSDAAA